jgi:hypothetical protein
MVPRGIGTGAFPASATVVIDGASSGTTTQNTVSNALGLRSPVYSGVGIFIEPKKSGTVWRFNFPQPPTDSVMTMGEIEFYGYVV